MRINERVSPSKNTGRSSSKLRGAAGAPVWRLMSSALGQGYCSKAETEAARRGGWCVLPLSPTLPSRSQPRKALCAARTTSSYARHMCPAGTEFTFLGWPLASFVAVNKSAKSTKPIRRERRQSGVATFALVLLSARRCCAQAAGRQGPGERARAGTSRGAQETRGPRIRCGPGRRPRGRLVTDDRREAEAARRSRCLGRTGARSIRRSAWTFTKGAHNYPSRSGAGTPSDRSVPPLGEKAPDPCGGDLPHVVMVDAQAS